MSFVGTRPEAVKYVEKYKPEYMATLLLPAGITSEASIRYKDEAELLNGAEDVDNQCKKECYCNPIVCSRAFLRLYVKNDLDLLMKIKVEAEEYDNGNIFKNNQISILMCFIATSSLVLNMEKEMGNTVLR